VDICIDGECILLPECTEDTECPEDYYTENYCSENDIYKDFHDFSCTDEECAETITNELITDCAEDCRDAECVEDYREDDDEDEDEDDEQDDGDKTDDNKEIGYKSSIIDLFKDTNYERVGEPILLGGK
tara:strand:- start:2878 stop:3264 length:387 start_codon:yes stop_codon:yes gene_type:complete